MWVGFISSEATTAGAGVKGGNPATVTTPTTRLPLFGTPSLFENSVGWGGEIS